MPPIGSTSTPPQYQAPSPSPQQSTWQPTSAPQFQSDQYSIDYLNSIAPSQQKTVNRFAVFGLIGAVIASMIVAVILIANSGGPNTNELLPPLQARLSTLHDVTEAQQKHLGENTISEANAALTSSLGSLDANLQTIMEERKVKKLSNKTSTQKTAADALSKTLDDAYQRGTLDRTYTTNMTYELTLLKSQVTKLRKSTSNTELREFCDSALSSIDLILKTYADFDATK